jgi:predicted transcriptional regulator
MNVESLSKMIDKRASYSIANIIKTLFLIHDKPIGRIELIKELNLNEAPIKTLLKNLQKNDLIKPSTKGNVLTVKGKKFVKKLMEKLSAPVDTGYTDYTVGKYNSAILVKDTVKKVKLGVEQRDEALKIGALGATTLVKKSGKLIFPGTNENASNFEDILKKHFSIKNGDVIIVCSASDYKKAEEGAIIAALSLLS